MEWIIIGVAVWYLTSSQSSMVGYPELVKGEVGDCSELARWTPHYQRAGAVHGIDWRLLAAQGCAESGLYPWALSAVGAAGIAQLMPSTARDWGLSVGTGTVDARGREWPLSGDPLADERFDPAKSIEVQAAIIRRNFDALGSMDLALAAYRSGVGRVRSRGISEGDEGYIRKIRAYLVALF